MPSPYHHILTVLLLTILTSGNAVQSSTSIPSTVKTDPEGWQAETSATSVQTSWTASCSEVHSVSGIIFDLIFSFASQGPRHMNIEMSWGHLSLSLHWNTPWHLEHLVTWQRNCCFSLNDTSWLFVAVGCLLICILYAAWHCYERRGHPVFNVGLIISRIGGSISVRHRAMKAHSTQEQTYCTISKPNNVGVF